MLEAQIRRDFDNIIWVSAAVHGTSLDIDVRENNDEISEVPSTGALSEKNPSSMTARYDGKVYSIIARTEHRW